MTAATATVAIGVASISVLILAVLGVTAVALAEVIAAMRKQDGRENQKPVAKQ
mgnify:CR=1 FL=1